MTAAFTVFGLKTRVILAGDDMAAILSRTADEVADGFRDGDLLVIAESALATSEGRAVELASVTPRSEAVRLAAQYHMDPRVAEVVIRESDRIVGGIPGFLLCEKQGTLLPNAGVDGSNAPLGCVVPLPADPDQSAAAIKAAILARSGARIGVLIADSRTHAMRLGCGGVAIGCAGITAVVDERGRDDLFGRKLEVTKRAVADNIVSAAELLMGEADECTPGVLVRGLGIPITDEVGIEGIAADECLFMGAVRGLTSDPTRSPDNRNE
ncbi:coenzyme F420-0:L-glutamate ligase [Methanosphaerula palustris]|uniref:F420-dependent oxidoreductase n=1 Tax=Methanosphaerula palustris (strain ATCC BAA-1556 / DSM 19958 / E1-9c) TaxID=521011 RepID=B8GG32_METPE|nr:coenzyme F420-0:L-glutamate ligase [Methanosphaerula palustris]ACL16106.1 F420-dependent oxidoreductase [Methanosphaerula palustris E1-9c]